MLSRLINYIVVVLVDGHWTFYLSGDVRPISRGMWIVSASCIGKETSLGAPWKEHSPDTLVLVQWEPCQTSKLQNDEINTVYWLTVTGTSTASWYTTVHIHSHGKLPIIPRGSFHCISTFLGARNTVLENWLRCLLPRRREWLEPKPLV